VDWLRISAAGALWLLVRVRFPMTRGSSSERSLWFVLVMFACSETLQCSVVRRAVDIAVPVSNLGGALMLGCGLLAAAGARNLFVALVTGRASPRPRWHLGLAAAALAAQTVCFLLAPPALPGAVYQADYYGGGLLALIRWGVFLGYLGWALAGMSAVTITSARRSPPGPLRTGLILGSIGTLLGFGYITLKATVAVGWTAGASPRLAPLDVAADVISLVSISLIALATVYEPLSHRLEDAVAAVTDRRSVARLDPLWRWLLTATPEIAARLENLNAHALLVRRVTEILDSQLVLLGYLPAELPRAALAAAELGPGCAVRLPAPPPKRPARRWAAG